ncbi:MAG: hypothetical protein ABIR23_04180 [Novosphingobium sp.]
MKNVTLTKGETTRRLNLIAGHRPSLPGHPAHREEDLRRDIAEHFAPVNAIEMLWVADIAYCTATIEVLRAQISGFKARLVRDAYQKLSADKEWNPQASTSLRSGVRNPMESASDGVIYAEGERHWLDDFAESNFQMADSKTALNSAAFAMVLSSMDRPNADQLRMLQQSLHDETRERDRLVSQFDRRRRQAMRDTIEWAEAKRRAGAAGVVLLDQDALEGGAAVVEVQGEPEGDTLPPPVPVAPAAPVAPAPDVFP